MEFVHAGFLAAGAAIAIPIIIHLLNRWQVRQIELGTMRFLHDVIREGAQRRKIRRWFLLLTRALICVLLAMLFARPFFQENVRRDGNRLRIILIDKSASMAMPGKSGRLIDDAIAAATDSASKLGSEAKIRYAWFDKRVYPVPDDQTYPKAPQVITGDTNYLNAISWARDQVNADKKSIADVILVTDLQQSGLTGDLAGEALAFPKDVPVQVIDVGRPVANNLAITHVAVPTKRLEVQQPVSINTTLFNFGTFPFEDIPLNASAFDGKRTVRLKKSITVPEGQAEEVKFEFGTLEPGVWRFTVAMDVEDDLAVDNRRVTAMEVAKPIKILVIDSGSTSDEISAESYFLRTALSQTDAERNLDEDLAATTESEPTDGQRFHPEVVFLGDDDPKQFQATEYPLAVVANAGSVTTDQLRLLEQYVRGGGHLLVFAGDGDTGLAQIWSESILSPGKLKQAVSAGVMPFRIETIDSRHTMLQPFADPQHGDLSRLAFRRRLNIDANEQTKVLAKFDGNQPALTQHAVDQSNVVWFLASADTSWSDWTKSPLYLPVVQQMAADLLNLTGEGTIRFRTVGDATRLAGASTSGASSTEVKNVSLRSDNVNTRLSFDQPGFRDQQGVLYVINGSSKESDPTRTDREKFTSHYGLIQADDDANAVSASVVGQKKNELWPWLAAALFVLLVGEFTLANRTTA